MAKSMNDIPSGEDGISVLENNPERITQQPFLALLGRMQNAKKNLNASKSKYDTIRKEMKNDGVSLKVLDFITKLMSMEDEDVVMMFHQIEDYMVFVGIDALRQLDLFGEKQEASDDTIEKAAYDAGYRAAHLSPDDATNPYQKGENIFEHWENGFSKGIEAAKAARLKANKPELEIVQ
ncbi:MAG: hypothetical protein HRU28_13250 [Rhizobiales bacterium]|nr:hypothetical protein [Hyphomicrobiales bacterium]